MTDDVVTYYASGGPKDGPWMNQDIPGCCGVLLKKDKPVTLSGTAYPGRWIRTVRGSVAAFRLVVNERDIPGRWVCISRQFVREDEWIARTPWAREEIKDD